MLTGAVLGGCAPRAGQPKAQRPSAPAAPAAVHTGAGTTAREADPVPAAQGAVLDPPQAPPVTVEPLAPNVWLHTSYTILPDAGAFPSHGLIVRTAEQVVLVDTAWNAEQTRELLRWTQEHLSASIDVAIVTHAHDDKMGGLPALHKANVETYALDLSNRDAPMRDLMPARHDLALEEGVATFAGGAVEVFYPGPGHTVDNVVVYIKEASLLFGGCLIRPGESSSLGYTADADVEHWDDAVRNVQERYAGARIVVPSHGAPAGPELLDHTLALVDAQRSQPGQ